MKEFKNNTHKDIFYVCKDKRDSSIFHYGVLSPGNVVSTARQIIYKYSSEDEWKRIVKRHTD